MARKKIGDLVEFMQNCSFETEIKVIIVGDGGIGKTTLMNRFLMDSFTSVYKKTIGVDFLEKHVFVPSIHEDVTFFLYDTAGQEEYNALTRSYYRGAGACIVAYSITDRSSFTAVPAWVAKVREECGMIPVVLVATKADLGEESSVTQEEATAQSLDLNLRLFRVSSKENINVNEVFYQLCFDYVRRRRLVGGQLENPVRQLDDLVAPPTSNLRSFPIRPPVSVKPASLFSNCTIS